MIFWCLFYVLVMTWADVVKKDSCGDLNIGGNGKEGWY